MLIKWNSPSIIIRLYSKQPDACSIINCTVYIQFSYKFSNTQAPNFGVYTYPDPNGQAKPKEYSLSLGESNISQCPRGVY